MLTNAVGRFRLISLLEGSSFLILLFIAMPLKYWGDWHAGVTIVGGAHGALFVLYMLALLHAVIAARWKLMRIAGAVAAAFIPFGTFVLDSRIRKNP